MMLSRGSLSLSALALGLVFSSLTACGAKTGLLLPDVPEDVVDVRDAPDVPQICVPGNFVFFRPPADVLFVIDRSNSMRTNFQGEELPPSRWSELRTGLDLALQPQALTNVQLGAVFYPQPQLEPGVEFACTVPTAVDVPIQGVAFARAAILNVFDTTQPSGGTPTAEAIRVARQYFQSRPDNGNGRSIVLATDGGPNCNGNLNNLTCNCTSVDMNGQPNCAQDPDLRFNCLDDQRTLRAIVDARNAGLPTFVIGIDDTVRPDLRQVLSDMAVAGGRPNPNGGPSQRYYSARSVADLRNAFETIQRAIAQCVFTTSARPTENDDVRITVDGMSVSRDTSHMNGWDWTAINRGEITLYGAACDRVANTTVTVQAEVGCTDR